MSETTNLERLRNMKERKKTTKMNKIANNLLEKRNDERYDNLKVAKT